LQCPTISATVPAPLAAAIRARAAADDRTVSYVVRRLLESSLENANGPAANGAAAKTGESAPDAQSD
jgi:plasmid stability protein